MKDFLYKPANFNRIEFWAASTIFAFTLFFFIRNGLNNTLFTPAKDLFENAGVSFSYYTNFFLPQLVRYLVLFPSFLLLNFIIVPRLLQRTGVFLNIFLIVLVATIVALVFGTTDTYLKAYLFTENRSVQDTYNFIFLRAFLLTCRLVFMFGLYTALKYTCIYLLTNSEKIRARYKFVTPGGLIAVVICMIILFLLLAAEAQVELVLAWGIFVPSGILLYLFSFHYLIPSSLAKKRPFLTFIGKTALTLLICYLPVSIFVIFFIRDEAAFAFSFLNSLFQLFITAPLSWMLYKRLLRGNEEVSALKTELGQSNANLDFLRSQINPHFLFNALNTIYGTAIQEKAERTSEGIERLGDMMRFMLQENMQEKIPLVREIEYLNNYIAIQRLRTDPNPNVKIESDIEETIHTLQIAPMLLIPFVENAFKHGISFREPSYIKISMEVKNYTLYFDVYNSKHPVRENDPEKDKSGIGLNNVKQRLHLLYPGKHELVVRETGKEFFVHLTIQLL